MTTPEVVVKVRLDDAQVKNALNNLSNRFRATAANINAMLDIAGKAMGAVNKLAESINAAVVAASRQEAAELRALTALRMRAPVTLEAFNALKKFNSAIQDRIGIGDEELLQLQGTLAAYGVMPEKIQDATKATIGLSEATGRDLNFAAREVAKRFVRGDEGLVGLFELATARAQTLDARLRAMSATSGDVTEKFGALFTQSGALKGGIDAITGAFRDLGGLLEQPWLASLVNRLFATITGSASLAIQSFLGLTRGVNAVVNAVVDGINKLLRTNIARVPILGERSIEDLADRLAAAASRGVEKINLETVSQVPQGAKVLAERTNAQARGTQELSFEAQQALATGEIMAEIEEAEFQRIQAHNERLQDAQDHARLKALNAEFEKRDFYRNLANQDAAREKAERDRVSAHYGMIAVSTLSGLSNIAGAALVGSEATAAAFGQLFAGLLDQTGDFLIKQGGASEIAAKLLTAFGIPGAGLPAIAAGIALKVAAGAARAALSKNLTDPNMRVFGGVAAPTVRSSGIPDTGFRPTEERASTVNHYQITFGSTFVAGSEAQVGREVVRMIEAAERLRGR